MDLLATVRRLARARGAALPDADSLHDLGDAWRVVESTLVAEAQAKPSQVAAAVEAFGRVADASGQDEPRGRAARLRASVATFRGDDADAIPAYEVAVQFLSGAPRNGAQIGLAVALARTGRTDEAVALCRAARGRARRRGDALIAAAALLNQATILHESGRPADALRPYRQAEQELDALGHEAFAASARQNRANALVLLDRFAAAQPLYDAAHAIFLRLGATAQAAQCRYNQGALRIAIDDIDGGLELLRQAEAEFIAAGMDVEAALTRIDHGDALLRARQPEEARVVLTRAVRSLGDRGPATERARAVLLLARAALGVGDATEVRRLLRRRLPADSVAIGAERDELRGRASALEGRLARAGTELVRAADAFGRRFPVGRARCLTAAAWCATTAGGQSTARTLARRGQRFAQQIGLPSLVFGAHAVRFLAEVNSGKQRAATTALTAAFAALEDVRAGLGPDALRAALLRGSGAWFARAVRHVLDTEGDAAALALLERWRARALVDILGTRRGSDVDDAHLGHTHDGDAHLDDLRARVSRLEEQAGGRAQPGFLRAADAVLDARSGADLADAERALAAGYRARLRADIEPPVDLARLAADLPRGTVVLSLLTDDADGLAFLVARDGVRCVRGVGSRDQVAAAVEELHFRFGRFALGHDLVQRHAERLQRETDAILEQLAERLLTPFADELARTTRLIVVPHGPWHLVPFAALPHAGGRLVNTVSIALAPSLGCLSRRVPTARGQTVVVDHADSRAPWIANEGAQVADVLGATRRLTGENATFAALRTIRRPRCLHIAAHGRFRADAPSMSGVELADGWANALSFTSLDLRGSLVVLSGCRTGVTGPGATPSSDGGEVAGLVRHLLIGGASDLVVGTWQVDDVETARLMTRFHALRAQERQAQRRSGEQALVAAQRELAAEGLHPWYWAGFALWTRRLRPARARASTAAGRRLPRVGGINPLPAGTNLVISARTAETHDEEKRKC